MGFYFPFDVVEQCYWTWRNSGYTCFPEPGGALDQDARLMMDLNTYHWWFEMAENNVEREETIPKLARAGVNGNK